MTILKSLSQPRIWISIKIVPFLVLKKEVIQPHLPVGLPCYDFIPVISLTFGASSPCGLSQRLRAKPTPMM